MRNKLNTLLFIIALAFIGQTGLYAQGTVACNNYQTICSNPTYTFNSVGGTGLTNGLNVSNPVAPPQGTNNGCMFTNVPNPEWLLINITSTGNLGFSFGAAGSTCPQTGYLHWIMWPYNGPSSCVNIFNNTLPPVACNYNCVAANGTGMGTIPAGGNICNYQPSIPVVQGQQYLILISNGTALANTCVSFSNTGTAGVSCNPLTVTNATACPSQQATVTATWLNSSNVNYTITSPAPAGGTSTQASSVIVVSKPLGTPAGDYVYTITTTGTNAFNQPITATQNFTLTINPTSTISVAHATNYCTGSCASITVSPGTGTFSIIGPSTGPPPTTNSVISLCNLQSPTNNGTYTITGNMNTGCTATQTLQINVAPNNFIAVGNSTINVCQNGIVNLQASMPTALSYTWTGPPATGYTAVVNSAINGNTLLTAVQPTSAGVYTVVADINFNGIACRRQATVEIAVVQTHSVVVTPSYTFCQGETVVVTGTTAGTPQNGYQWTGPVPFATVNSATATISNSIIPAEAGTYILSAFFSNGQLNCQVSSNTNIQVVPVNPPAVLIPTLLCQYETANMALNAPVGNPIYFEWGGPNGFSSTNISTVIVNVNPSHSGIYTGTVVYAIGTKTCMATNSRQMTVIPVNSITVVSPVSSCYPQNVGLFSSAIGATSYSWSGPNSFTASTANAVVYYAPTAASGIYTVYTTYNTGGKVCTNTIPVAVTVNSAMQFSLIPYVQACKHETLALNGPAGAATYSWTGSVAISSVTPVNGQNLVFPDLTPDQSGTYVLSVSAGSCVSSRSVQINVLEPITFSLVPQGRTICRGDTTLMEVGVKDGSQNYAYEWYPNSYLSAPTGPVVTGIPLGTTVYNITAYDIACPKYKITYPFTVVVKQPPIPQLVLDRTEGCQPLCLFYDSKTQADAAITTYDFGGVLKMQADSFNFCLNQPGSYTLKVLSEGNNGCIGVYTYPVPLVVFPKANPDITWSPDVPSTTDNLVTFNATPKAGTIVSYNWMFTGTGVSGPDTTTTRYPMRKYESTGKFPVMLISTTEQGCVDTTLQFLEIKDELNVFIPNSFTPNNDGINDVFQVKGIGFKVESFILEIFDRWGHSIYSTKEIAKGWDGTVKGQNPSEGVYVYKVRIIGANGEGRKEYVGHVTLLK